MYHVISWTNADNITRQFVTDSPQDASAAYSRLHESPALSIRWDIDNNDCGIPPAASNDQAQARGNVIIRRELRKSGLCLPALPAVCLTTEHARIFRALRLLREAYATA